MENTGALICAGCRRAVSAGIVTTRGICCSECVPTISSVGIVEFTGFEASRADQAREHGDPK